MLLNAKYRFVVFAKRYCERNIHTLHAEGMQIAQCAKTKYSTGIAYENTKRRDHKFIMGNVCPQKEMKSQTSENVCR